MTDLTPTDMAGFETYLAAVWDNEVALHQLILTSPSGQLDEPVMPFWRDLPDDKRKRFALLIRNASDQITLAARHIAGLSA